MDRRLKKIIYAVICIIILVAVDLYVALSASFIQAEYDRNTNVGYCSEDYDLDVVSEIEAVTGDNTSPTKGAARNRGSMPTTAGWALLIILTDIPIIVFFVCLYNATTRKEDGTKRKGIPLLIVLMVLCVGFAGFMSYGIVQYIKMAQKAAQDAAIRVHAPIIYLYSETEEPVNITLDLNGSFTYTYPEYVENKGWTVTPSSDGTLTDEAGMTYEYIIWEADMFFEPDLSKGFCVKGSETEAFLNTALRQLGLNDKEIADFIEYWLPKMEGNPYNVISFQTDTFNDVAVYDVAPSPDVVVRVNMLWYASDEFVDIAEQSLDGINCSVHERYGLTFVEWGGERLDEAH